MSASSTAWGERLLAERAQRLAERPQVERDVPRRRVCICEVSGNLFGLPVEAIARVIPAVTPAPLADADPSLLGIISRGGGFALVYDLASLTGGAPSTRTGEAHLVLLRHQRPLTALKVARTIAIEDIDILSAEEAVNLPARVGVAAYGRHSDNRIVSMIDIAALMHTSAPTLPGG